MATVALDIETISPGMDNTGDVDFLNSRDFEVVAVGVAHRRSPNSEIESEVLWRNETRTGDEYKLLRRTVEWLNDRHYDSILTYNGVNFDERHLRGRAAVIADELGDLALPEDMHRAWQTAYHRDLMHNVVRDQGHRLSFDDAVEEYVGERPPTVQWDGEPIDNGDIPELAEQLLAYRAGLSDLNENRATHLRDVLETYIEADIYPLFDLYDEFDR